MTTPSVAASKAELYQIDGLVRSGAAGLIPWAIKYLPHLFPVESAEFHWEIAQLAEEHDRVVVAAPRSHAKSTLLALAYPLFRAACYKEPFILLVSDTGPQAEQRTSDIYAELMENRELIRDYPHLALPEGKDYLTKRVKKTTKEFITIAGIRFTGAGAGQSLRGIRERQNRPTLIVVDDLENDEAVLTPYQREKLYSWFTKALLNLPGSSGARIVVIGTILHQESLLAGLLKTTQAGVWHQRLFRAIDTNGDPLWPAAWSLEALAKQKRLIGSRAFSSEYLNEPVDDETAMFKLGWIEANRRFAHPELNRLVVAIDPSASSKGDAAGIVAGGVHGDHGYVLEDNTVQGSPLIWARVALETYWRLQADEIVAEKNNGGEMVITTLSAALRPGEVLPPVRLVWASRGKQVRADPVAALVESGRIHMVGEFPKLEKELTSWVPGMDSPNRLDAFVWLFTALMLDPQSGELMLAWEG